MCMDNACLFNEGAFFNINFFHKFFYYFNFFSEINMSEMSKFSCSLENTMLTIIKCQFHANNSFCTFVYPISGVFDMPLAAKDI